MKKNKSLGVLLIFLSFFCFAETEKPANFTSDRANYNLKTREYTFDGHVIMTKGEDRLYADKVITYRDKKGNVNKIIAYGKPVNYLIYGTDKRLIRAEALTLEYYPLIQRAILIGEASITQDNNKSIKAPRIIYDLNKHEIVGQSNSRQQSHLIFTPNDFQKEK